MAVEVGSRVGAIAKANADTVWLYGFGIYEGRKVPDPELGVMVFGMPMAHENPCIRLDSGKLVFGCECWWRDEEGARTMIGDRAVIEVDIEVARAESRGEAEK